MVLRSGLDGDLDRLVEIRNEPEVLRWWGHAGRDEIRDTFIAGDRGLVIEVEGEVVGGIEFAEEEDPMYRHASMDIFVSTAQQGRGFGSEALRLLARYLFEERGHHRLTIDPAAENRRAIRVYERVGFRPVGIMRKYERGPDGSWRDGLLMDMLAGDFRP